jgi:hypothetical protein
MIIFHDNDHSIIDIWNSSCNDKMKDDAIAQLSDQLLSTSTRLQGNNRSNLLEYQINP